MSRPFRLETVARLREASRDAARAQLSDAHRAAEVIRTKQAELAQTFATLVEQRREATASSSADAAWLLNAGRYELVLRADEHSLRDDLKAIEREIERRRGLVAEAEREVRALELLREQDERRARDEENRREALRLDEFAGQQAFAKSAASQPLT